MDILFMGVFILAWLISGILMVTPTRWLGDIEPKKSRHSVDYSQIVLSPTDVISGLVAGKRAPQNIRSATLKKINDRVLYAVRFYDAETQLFDAQSGKPFVVTRDLVEAMARDAFPTDAAIQLIEKLEDHDLA